MSLNLPNHQYYHDLHGCWSSPFQFEIINWKEFWKDPIKLSDRMSLLGFFLMIKYLGNIKIETTLDYHHQGPSKNKVLHTTKIRFYCLTIMKGVELFRLNDNGQDVSIEGKQSFFPCFWKTIPYINSHCTISKEAHKATYQLSLYGLPLKQNTEIIGEDLKITMNLAWAKGTQWLKRIQPTLHKEPPMSG